MPEQIGFKAIDRAVASTDGGGILELGFFGGEPLLEAGLVGKFLEYAKRRTATAGIRLSPGLTTNGTQIHPEAWMVMMDPELNLAVSCDGLPQIHDRHRVTPDGDGTAELVLETIKKLLAAGREFRAVMVIRPDNVEYVLQGIEFLRTMGVEHIDLALDIWTRWTAPDLSHLEQAIIDCADLWRKELPKLGINWFDEKLVRLTKVQTIKTARCGFGNGEIAVAPSGTLYPCERLIGEDCDTNTMRIAGHTTQGEDFIPHQIIPGRSEKSCTVCAVQSLCNTECRCSNYIRTGNVEKPDRLLCVVNQVCLRETMKLFVKLRPVT